jgi:hypothetical protein
MTSLFSKAVPAPPHSIALCGGSGSGKTRTALHIARAISSSVCVIDCGERASSSGYSVYVPHDNAVIPPPLSLKMFHLALEQAASYDVVVIDSLSEIWLSILRYKEDLDAGGGNGFTNWGKAGRLWDGVISAIHTHPSRIVACVRAKNTYVLETNERGRQAPRSIGLQPVMRDGTEYGFDIWCTMTDKTLSVTQPRHCTELEDLVLYSPSVADCEVFR